MEEKRFHTTYLTFYARFRIIFLYENIILYYIDTHRQYAPFNIIIFLMSKRFFVRNSISIIMQYFAFELFDYLHLHNSIGFS